MDLFDLFERLRWSQRPLRQQWPIGKASIGARLSTKPTMAHANSTERNLLPTNIKPLSYSVELQPDFKEERFYGRVDIR